MEKIKSIIEALILFYKIGVIPKVGDIVQVAVGFSPSLNEGVVESVHDGYCWIHQYDKNGKFKNAFTASFGYCVFNIVKCNTIPKEFV